MSYRRNRFGRMEWAGAFGDLGTLIPFTVAYISLLKMDPFGILFTFGLAKIISGLYYKTPFPVQPMKALAATATTQAAQTLTLTPDMVYGAGLVTGLTWFILALTGLTERVGRLVSRPVVCGMILGLGFSFMLDGIQMMASGWALSIACLTITLLLLTNKSAPAMLIVLLLSAAVGIVENPTLLTAISNIEISVRLPSWALGTMTWHDVALGALFLALPQLPLTLGNAVIAITEENNRLFFERPVTERSVSISTGIMNFIAPMMGGVPMCHGAGGMAGHVRFGATTGGALIILGALLLVLAVFFSNSIGLLFRIFPQPVLGVILFLAGSQLALGTCADNFGKKERSAMLTTAAFAMWNIGIAIAYGVIVDQLLKRDIVKL